MFIEVDTQMSRLAHVIAMASRLHWLSVYTGSPFTLAPRLLLNRSQV